MQTQHNQHIVEIWRYPGCGLQKDCFGIQLWHTGMDHVMHKFLVNQITIIRYHEEIYFSFYVYDNLKR